MNFTCIFFGSIFIAVGIWLGFFQGYRHIPEWKSMTRDEQDKIKIIPLSRNIGTAIAVSGGIFLAKGIFDGKWFIWAMITWLIAAGLDVWYITKSKYYTKRR